MYTPLVAILLSLALFGSASPTFHHRHHLHEREAEPQTVTVYVDGNGNPVSSAGASPAAASSTSAAAAAAASSSTASSASAASSSAAAASAPVAGGSLSFGKGVNYSPYTANGGCKDASTVASDLAAFSDCTVIRLFDVDCNGIQNVFAANPNFKIMAGVKNMGDISGSLSTMISAVGGKWDRIYAVTVGDELINSGQASVSQVQGYISQAKSILSGTYGGVITTVDSQNVFQSQPSLCGVVDAVFVNAHPFFDSACPSSNAGNWLQSQISSISSLCGGKQVIITETGWPWQGSANGAAVPSASDQSAALAAIGAAVTSNILYFSAYDSPWMSPGQYGVEPYWGLQH